ncbi:hypothetical protein MB02_00815 [Croceicoccus estronivorus]|uniref:Nmad3 family putative nucleotide modification protein n=1 Tax=Croceicoccus estronivorus TaxID=1172626 RepID=UPI0008374BCE|nr:hypothetical protein [Croceicoccus estronivorus]OCC25257.1 hypothetical protein MB02_00815 [Croceicoccus estronivorus]
MRIIFSRKGFDSSAGGRPSPIIDGRPISLPIPAQDRSHTTYADRQLGDLVEETTRGRIRHEALCHDDPMFAREQCWFGQCAAAQGHLAKNDVGTGDVFLFFGLFADPESGERHHRIFGYMQVACFGAPDDVRQADGWNEPPRAHPHLIGEWGGNNTIYHGPGALAAAATPSLRLTVPGGPLNRWSVPAWLQRYGLTYHGKNERWPGKGELIAASRGQEFICDIGNDPLPHRWLNATIAAIRG